MDLEILDPQGRDPEDASEQVERPPVERDLAGVQPSTGRIAGFDVDQAYGVGQYAFQPANGNDPYAIPPAPDSNAPATAFLLNHEPTVYGEENGDARIVLKATQDAWVQVRDRQGNLLLTRVLRVGDSYMVPNQADLTLLTGNAGGLEISVDGSALPALGPVGAVRRNIPLDPEALRDGAGRQP